MGDTFPSPETGSKVSDKWQKVVECLTASTQLMELASLNLQLSMSYLKEARELLEKCLTLVRMI